VVIGRGNGDVRGAFDLRQSEPHRVGFGYVLARRWWGQGLMTEALTEVVHWALHQDGVFRIGSTCDVENIGSARVMEKAGLLREGLLRRWLIHPNLSSEPRDCFSYARVR
jgi:RimJ/RimL family protein N-acetyltransferase